MNRVTIDGVGVYRFEGLERHGLKAIVSTRQGGVSTEPFDTLNLGLRVGDDPGAVVANRERLFDALELELERSVWCRQVHGGHVSVVDARDAGRGARDEDDVVRDTDALVTGSSNVPLCVTLADCVPVIVYDPDHHVVGLSHAGWGGTVSHITFNTVVEMQERFDSRPDQLVAAIGPSISPDRYEVGPDVISKVADAFPGSVDSVLKPVGEGKALFDLWQANRLELTNAGIPATQIEISGISTIDNQDEFFSARAERTTGRFIALVCLQPRG